MNNSLKKQIVSHKKAETILRKKNKIPSLVSQKKKVLVWSDSVTATTGFGIVSKYILKALHETGEYEIDQLAINYFGDFYDREETPYTLVPAKLGDPKDPYGNQMFINSLQKKDYDIVFVINDTFVTEEVAQHIQKIKMLKYQQGKPVFSLVYYYPVDCRFLEGASTLAKIADRSVAYTNFAKQSAQMAGVEPTDVIYHGTDIETYHQLDKKEIQHWRRQYLRITDDNRFLFINVNRNSIRKDLARTILAFSEFKKQVPNSCLYLHTAIKDGVNGYINDLRVPVDELGLDMTKDVIFPTKYSPAKGYPDYILNRLYNCADAFITTTLGEGWGLTSLEAMATGTPVITGNHTVVPEIFGKNQERGYIYDCKEKIYIDNSGFRPWGRMEDIQEQMTKCYFDWKENQQRRTNIIKEGRKFAENYSWNNVCKQWIKLFSELSTDKAALTVSEGEKL